MFKMSENIEPEALPSTSQSVDVQKPTIFPLVSLPKVVLTRLDVKNLPALMKTTGLTVEKTPKKTVAKKNKTVVSKTISKKTIANSKTDSRLRDKPKKDYKMLSEIGNSPVEKMKNKTPLGKFSGIVKKTPKFSPRQEDNSIKGMLKKTMLQRRSKIVIPPAKKPKLMQSKAAKPSVSPLTPKKEKPVVANTQKKHSPLQMDTDDTEDEFLYDELIDELVNPSNKKVGVGKTTNITLKPNVGNKPPTIVKGGIVKKSSLPPDLKAVASPTTLNSSKLTGTSLNSKPKTSEIDVSFKTPATAESPKANLPVKASPFPITINSPSPKDQGKRGPKSKSVSAIKKDQPPNFKATTSQITQKPKSPTSVFKPRGRPRIGPKQVVLPSLVVKPAADDESDEYTEVETLESIDAEPAEPVAKVANDASKNEDIQVIAHEKSNFAIESVIDSKVKSKNDGDPHLDLLRILTGDTEDSQSEPSELKEMNSENPQNLAESSETNVAANTVPPTPTDSSHSPEKSVDLNASETPECQETGDSGSKANKPSPVPNNLSPVPSNSGTSDSANNLSQVPVVEEAPRVRTIYDLMAEVSLQYPSWNLHIIPETNAFCIAQVTKGRLGLPTLKKCIELDADTYSAKVYIHQYHIKRFDGVYDSEDAILGLIEEIHSIKA